MNQSRVEGDSTAEYWLRIMGRRRVSVEYIQKDKERCTTYKKRKKGLVMKAYELATLCDVPLCMVIYPAGPNSTPVTCPEKEEEVVALIKRYVSGSRENAKRRLKLEQVLALANKKKKNSNSDPPLPQPQQVYPTWHPPMDVFNRDDLVNLTSLLDCTSSQGMDEDQADLFTNAPVMCKASSSVYDPNLYLPENNVLPRPYPLTTFYNHPPPLGPGLRSWTSPTKIFATMEVNDAKTQDNKENIVPAIITPLLTSPSEISSKKKNTAARWRRMRVPLRDITNLFNSIEAQSSSSFLPTYQSVDFVASDLNPRKRKAANDHLKKHPHISRSLRMGFR